jgi:hypothetical protein
MPMIRGLTFEQWIEHAFDRPEDEGGTDAPGAGYWGDLGEVKAAYLAETFENPDRHIARFSDRQLENALWSILSGGYAKNALAKEIPFDLRIRFVASTYGLFSKLFAARCPKLELGGGSPLYTVCYMFWEQFPIFADGGDAESERLFDESLTVMEKTLELDGLMCQYAALHGLGHAQSARPERVAESIDRYLARHPEPEFELRDYALDARAGAVQ